MQTNCIFCLKQYLLDYYGTSINTQMIGQEMQALMSQPMTYFVHPGCSRHFAYRISDAQIPLEVSKTGPFTTLTVKDLNTRANLPFIGVVSSRVKASLTTPIIVGRGNDFDKSRAILKAKMEVLERICAYYQPRTQFQFGLAENFNENILAMHASIFDERRWWLKTQVINKDINKYIPLEYCQLESISTVEDPIVKASSAGMAVHDNVDKAIKNGFFEIAEKIAVKAIFNHKLTYCVNADALPAKYAQLMQVIQELGYKLIILHHEEARVHGFLIMIVNRQMQLKQPALIFGSGAHSRVNLAFEHALLEAYAQLIHALEVYPFNLSNTNSVYDKFLYYFEPENALNLLKKLDIENLSIKKLDSIEQKNSSFASIIEHYPHPVLWVDRGNILMDYLGLHAVQVLIPNAYPELIKSKTREAAYEW